MKKILCLSFLSLFALSGCASEPEPENDPEPTPSPEVEKVKVTFKTPFEDIEPIIVEVEKGKTIATEPSPVKEGYHLENWCLDKDGNNEFDVNTIINTDITLYGSYFPEVNASNFSSSIETLTKMYLTEDIDLTENYPSATSGYDPNVMFNLKDNAIIDLGGHTIKNYEKSVGYDGKNITLQNGTFEVINHSGQNDGRYSLMLGIDDNKTSFTLKNLKGIGGFNIYCVTTNIIDCEVTASNYDSATHAIYFDEGGYDYYSLTINGGKYSKSINSSSLAIAPENSTNSQNYIKVLGGEFNTNPTELVDTNNYSVTGPNVNGYYKVTKK